jgi:prefoldin subunit 5
MPSDSECSSSFVAVKHERELSATCREYDEQYDELQCLVRSLPDKPVHEVMVPCTKFAMFEGELSGGDTLFVGVGAEYIVECNTEQTCAIIQRRRELLQQKIRDADHNAAAMQSRLLAMDALEASGSAAGGLPTVLEDEELITDGRARIARKGDGSVEITEVYELEEDITAISTLGSSTANERYDAGVVRCDLDDFISRLEAMEMSETGKSVVEEDNYSENNDTDADDSDVDIDGGEPPDITCPEDFPKYERWKAKRDAKTTELKAAAEEARRRAEEERERNEREYQRKNPPLKAEVIERAPGEQVKDHNAPDEMRPMSLYQRKKLGLL